MTIEIDEAQRELIVLAMALTRLQRPGFEFACRDTVKKLHGERLFEHFVVCNSPPVGVSKPGDKEYLRLCADQVKARLPDNYGFILVAAPFGQASGRMVYVSSMRREDAINVLKEWLIKVSGEEEWMKHIVMSRDASMIRWFADSPEDGWPDCICSYCGLRIEAREDLGLEEHEEDPEACGGIRLFRTQGAQTFEARFHDRCFNEVLDRGLITLNSGELKEGA